jgi:hypothetical protein
MWLNDRVVVTAFRKFIPELRFQPIGYLLFHLLYGGVVFLWTKNSFPGLEQVPADGPALYQPAA